MEGKTPISQRLLAWSASPVGRIVLPLFVLAVFYAVLYSPFGIFGKHGPGRPTLSPAEAQKLDNSSRTLLSQQKFQEALAPSLQLHEVYPGNHIYIARLADIYDHLERYGDEAQMWEQYLDRAPTPVEGCPQYGQAYQKWGDGHEKEAIAAFERCLALDPTNTDSIFYMAHALELEGEWDRAAALYERGIVLSPSYTDLQLGLARCRVRQDRLDEAKATADKVLARSPDKADALLIMGMIYMHQDKYAEAKKYLAHGAQVSPNDPDFPTLLVRVASNMNDSAEELRQYNKLVELKPEDKQIRAKRDALAAKK
jgi:tetratricopeptide (TPR) repeat protein